MNTRTFVLLMALPAVIVLSSLGCTNIFGVFGAPTPNGTYDELVLLGQNESQAKRYNNALIYFDAAIAKNPSGSRARVYAADAIFLRDAAQIATIVTTYNNNVSGNPFSALVNVMNNPPAGNDLFSATGSFAQMANYLNNRYGHSYVYGRCDGAISNTSLFANIEFIFASAFLQIGEFFDSNGDKHYAQADDLFMLDGGGNIAVNTNSFNIGAMTNTTVLANGNFANMSYEDLTNMIDLMRTTHNTLEDVMSLFKSIYSSIKRVDDVNAAAVRIGTAMPSSFFGMSLSIDTASITNSLQSFDATVRAPVNSIAATLNTLHVVLTGAVAYPSNDVVYFTPSAWATHTGGLKGTADSAISVLNSIAALGVPLAGLTDWTTLTNTIATNDMAAFSNFISNISSMSNEMTNIMNMLTNLTTNFTGF
ncbi:MAG: hypothetical protein AABZ39_01270 [Spirochaetota bacterium]